MSAAPTISDAYTVSTVALCRASGINRVSLWRHQKLGNLGTPQRRPGVRQNFWTASQANKFLRRLGKPEQF